MTANELKIGNFVNVFYKSPDGRKKLIHRNAIINAIDNYSHDIKHTKSEFDHPSIENLEPIPLTEEWLIKFGFEQKNEFYYVLNDFEIGLSDDDFVKNQRTLRYKKAIVLKVKYVHQLQNLFLTLTGEELKIID